MIAIAVLLASLAGFVDALAFTSMGGFFASFMSGNSTRLGIGLGTDDPGVAMMAASLILSFVSGVIAASVIERAAPRHRKAAVMAAVTLLLAAAAILASIAPGSWVLVLLAAAMGVENGVFNRDGEVAIGLTYMTGALVRMGQRLAAALMGDPDRWAWMRWLTLWLGFVTGVMMGASAQAAMGWDALWLAVAGAAALTVAIGWIGRGAAPMPASPWRQPRA